MSNNKLSKNIFDSKLMPQLSITKIITCPNSGKVRKNKTQYLNAKEIKNHFLSNTKIVSKSTLLKNKKISDKQKNTIIKKYPNAIEFAYVPFENNQKYQIGVLDSSLCDLHKITIARRNYPLNLYQRINKIKLTATSNIRYKTFAMCHDGQYFHIIENHPVLKMFHRGNYKKIHLLVYLLSVKGAFSAKEKGFSFNQQFLSQALKVSTGTISNYINDLVKFNIITCVDDYYSVKEKRCRRYINSCKAMHQLHLSFLRKHIGFDNKMYLMAKLTYKEKYVKVVKRENALNEFKEKIFKTDGYVYEQQTEWQCTPINQYEGKKDVTLKIAKERQDEITTVIAKKIGTEGEGIENFENYFKDKLRDNEGIEYFKNKLLKDKDFVILLKRAMSGNKVSKRFRKTFGAYIAKDIKNGGSVLTEKNEMMPAYSKRFKNNFKQFIVGYIKERKLPDAKRKNLPKLTFDDLKAFAYLIQNCIAYYHDRVTGIFYSQYGAVSKAYLNLNMSYATSNVAMVAALAPHDDFSPKDFAIMNNLENDKEIAIPKNASRMSYEDIVYGKAMEDHYFSKTKTAPLYHNYNCPFFKHLNQINYQINWKFTDVMLKASKKFNKTLFENRILSYKNDTITIIKAALRSHKVNVLSDLHSGNYNLPDDFKGLLPDRCKFELKDRPMLTYDRYYSVKAPLNYLCAWYNQNGANLFTNIEEQIIDGVEFIANTSRLREKFIYSTVLNDHAYSKYYLRGTTSYFLEAVDKKDSGITEEILDIELFRGRELELVKKRRKTPFGVLSSPFYAFILGAANINPIKHWYFSRFHLFDVSRGQESQYSLQTTNPYYSKSFMKMAKDANFNMGSKPMNFACKRTKEYIFNSLSQFNYIDLKIETHKKKNLLLKKENNFSLFGCVEEQDHLLTNIERAYVNRPEAMVSDLGKIIYDRQLEVSKTIDFEQVTEDFVRYFANNDDLSTMPDSLHDAFDKALSQIAFEKCINDMKNKIVHKVFGRNKSQQYYTPKNKIKESKEKLIGLIEDYVQEESRLIPKFGNLPKIRRGFRELHKKKLKRHGTKIVAINNKKISLKGIRVTHEKYANSIKSLYKLDCKLYHLHVMATKDTVFKRGTDKIKSIDTWQYSTCQAS